MTGTEHDRLVHELDRFVRERAPELVAEVERTRHWSAATERAFRALVPALSPR